jgi:TatA/E family protein of Tat protein translocase
MGIESPVHLLFIAVVALIVLGPKRLPGLAKALGQGIREFRSSLEDGAGEADATAPSAAHAQPTPAQAPEPSHGSQPPQASHGSQPPQASHGSQASQASNGSQASHGSQAASEAAQRTAE